MTSMSSGSTAILGRWLSSRTPSQGDEPSASLLCACALRFRFVLSTEEPPSGRSSLVAEAQSETKGL